jgi:hypothetical protein
MRRFVLAAAIASSFVAREAWAQEPLPSLPPPPQEEPPPAAQEPPPPPPEPPRLKLRRPTHPDESSFVTVTIDADSPGVYLETLTEHEGYLRLRHRWHTDLVYARGYRWQPICKAPCNMRVPPDLRYRIGGPSVPASDTFTIGPSGADAHLRVNAGSKSGLMWGAVMLAIGIPTSIVGVIVVAASHDDTRTAGWITTGAGVALITIGAIMLATNGTTVYDDKTGRTIGKLRLSPSGFVF